MLHHQKTHQQEISMMEADRLLADCQEIHQGHMDHQNCYREVDNPSLQEDTPIQATTSPSKIEVKFFLAEYNGLHPQWFFTQQI